MTYSLIIPCYNEEENLVELAKLCRQLLKSRKNIEIILVNNGSRDRTGEIMMCLQKKYSFLHIITIEDNIGYGYGILKGLEAAGGEYLGWLHADMQISPLEVIKAIELIEEYPHQEKVFVRGTRRNRPLLDKIFTINMSLFESIYLGTWLWDINAQPTMVPRQFFETWKNPPYDFSLDLYAYYMAKQNKYKIFRFKVKQQERQAGKSSWNTGMKARLKLIKRVVAYSRQMKRQKY